MPRQIAVGDVAIDRELHQVGLGQLQHRGRDDRGERQRDLRLVRPQIPQQPPHQRRVVGLTEDFFFVEGHDVQLPATGCQLPAARFPLSFAL